MVWQRCILTDIVIELGTSAVASRLFDVALRNADTFMGENQQQGVVWEVGEGGLYIYIYILRFGTAKPNGQQHSAPWRLWACWWVHTSWMIHTTRYARMCALERQKQIRSDDSETGRITANIIKSAVCVCGGF